MTPTTTIDLGSNTYQIGTLSAMKQFHIMRRLAPMLATVGAGFASLKEAKGTEDFLPFLGPLSEVLAEMSDEQAEYIIKTCMEVVSRKQGDAYQRMITQGQFVFQDLSMTEMIRLTVEVVKANMQGFFSELGAET